jgi:hypothetical protein
MEDEDFQTLTFTNSPSLSISSPSLSPLPHNQTAADKDSDDNESALSDQPVNNPKDDDSDFPHLDYDFKTGKFFVRQAPGVQSPPQAKKPLPKITRLETSKMTFIILHHSPSNKKQQNTMSLRQSGPCFASKMLRPCLARKRQRSTPYPRP